MNKNKLRIITAIAACLFFAVLLFGCGEVAEKNALEDVTIVQSEVEIEDKKVSDNSAENTVGQATAKEEVKPDEEEQSKDDKPQEPPLSEKDEIPQEQLGEDIQTQENEFATDADENAQTQEDEPEADTAKDMVCTLYVNCKSVLQNYDMLKENKKSVIPKDGIIYAEKSVSFSEGESAFDILKREMRNSNIHLEFVYTPVYNSVYIEGIGNLYEFDCGDTSGWSYKVNGVKPNYGCSQYIVKSGDNIEFYYSCDFLSES
ncbi:MAG: DUF4430 domain-containing protein [Clostridia bacterium]|nr:DUF4430 domain-containing protein [Clostridia bacterium]